MSNFYSILPKLLTWIIIDEVDLDLPCGVCDLKQSSDIDRIPQKCNLASKI